MSMSKKDFEAVAKMIREEMIPPTLADLKGLYDSGWCDGHRAALREVSEKLAAIFAVGNSRFDRARFMRACGFDGY